MTIIGLTKPSKSRSTFICICIYMLKNPWCMHPRYRPICLMYCTIIKERFCIRQGNNLTYEVFPLKSHLGKSFACLLSDGNSLMLYPIRNRCVLIGLDHLQIVVPDNRCPIFSWGSQVTSLPPTYKEINSPKPYTISLNIVVGFWFWILMCQWVYCSKTNTFSHAFWISSGQEWIPTASWMIPKSTP